MYQYLSLNSHSEPDLCSIAPCAQLNMLQVVFVTYMLMFVAQGILVTGPRHGAASYSYNTVTVVLITELLKLILSSGLYLKE